MKFIIFVKLQRIYVIIFTLQVLICNGAFASNGSITSTGSQILSLRKNITVIDQKLPSMHYSWQQANTKLHDKKSLENANTYSKIQALLFEKEQSRKELIAGFFCSQCKRSKSQIERETHKAFEEHLTDVKGEAIPMTPEDIAKQMDKYDQKILALQNRFEKLASQIKNKIAANDEKFGQQILRLKIENQSKKFKLQQLILKFKYNIQRYNDDKQASDRRWYGQWLKQSRDMAATSAIALAKKTRRIKFIQQKLTLAIANEDTVQSESIESSFMSLLAERKVYRQSTAQKQSALANRYTLSNGDRIKSRVKIEKPLNEIIVKVGAGTLLSSWKKIPNNIHISPSSLLDSNQHIVNENLPPLLPNTRNVQSGNWLQKKYYSTLNNLKKSITENSHHKETLVRNINKIKDGLRKVVSKKYLPNLANEIAETALKQSPMFSKSTLNKVLSPERFKKAAKSTVGSWSSWLHGVVSDTVDHRMKQRFPDLDDLYNNDFYVRLTNSNYGYHTWFTIFDNEDEGVRRYVKEIFAPFDRMVDKCCR